MNFNIYSYGNGDILIDVFNAIALIAGSSMINSAIMVAVLSGFLMFLAGGVFSPHHHHNFNWKWLVGWVLILELFWVPRANVQVVDQNFQFVSATAPPLITNIPLGLAVATHLATTVGKGMTDTVETAFSDPSGISYSQNGLGFSQNLLSTSTQAYFPPGQVKADMDAYIESCVMMDILSGATNPATLANSQNLLTDIASNSARIVYIGNPPTATPCQVAYNTIVTEANAFKPAGFADWTTHVFNMQAPSASNINSAIQTEIGTTLLNTYNGIQATGYSNAQDIIFQSMMIHQMSDSVANFIAASGGSGQSAMMNMGIAQAEQQTKNQWVVAGELAKKYLPMFRGMAEGFIYGLFPLVFLGMLLPGGGKMMKMYGLGVLWIQSWSPLYSILNHFIFKYSAKAINGTPGLSQASYVTLNSGAQDMLAVLGIMGTTIPMVALAMIKGAEIGGSAMLGAISSGMSSGASSGAATTTTGNINYGNASVGNTSFGNSSAFQNNTAYAFSGGDHSAFYDNQRSYMSGTKYDLGSSGPMHLNYSNAVSSQVGSQIKNAKDTIETSRFAYETAMASNIHKVESLKQNASHTHQSGNTVISGETASVGSHYQNAYDAVGKFMKSQGLDMSKQEQYMTQALYSMEASGGLPKIFGVGVGAELSSIGRVDHSATTKLSNDLKTLEETMKSEGVQNIKNDMTTYAKDQSAGTTDLAATTITKDIEANLTKADSSVKQSSRAYTLLDQWQKTQEYTEQHAQEMKTDGDIWINKAVSRLYGEGKMESVMSDPVKRNLVYTAAQEMASDNFLAMAKQNIQRTTEQKLRAPTPTDGGPGNDQKVIQSAGERSQVVKDAAPFTTDGMEKNVDGSINALTGQVDQKIKSISEANNNKEKEAEHNYKDGELPNGSADLGAIDKARESLPDPSTYTDLRGLNAVEQGGRKASGWVVDRVKDEFKSAADNASHYSEKVASDPRANFNLPSPGDHDLPGVGHSGRNEPEEKNNENQEVKK